MTMTPIHTTSAAGFVSVWPFKLERGLVTLGEVIEPSGDVVTYTVEKMPDDSLVYYPSDVQCTRMFHQELVALGII